MVDGGREARGQLQAELQSENFASKCQTIRLYERMVMASCDDDFARRAGVNEPSHALQTFLDSHGTQISPIHHLFHPVKEKLETSDTRGPDRHQDSTQPSQSGLSSTPRSESQGNKDTVRTLRKISQRWPDQLFAFPPPSFLKRAMLLPARQTRDTSLAFVDRSPSRRHPLES